MQAHTKILTARMPGQLVEKIDQLAANLELLKIQYLPATIHFDLAY